MVRTVQSKTSTRSSNCKFPHHRCSCWRSLRAVPVVWPAAPKMTECILHIYMRHADAALARCKTTRNCISGRCCCVHPTTVGCCIKLAGANQACIIYFAKMAARRRRRIISRGNGFHLFARGARICERVATRWEKNQIESMTGSETARERKCIDSSRCVRNKNASSFSEHVISFAYTLLNSSTGQLRM